MLTRRALVPLLLAGTARAQPVSSEGTPAERSAMADLAVAFMARHSVPGLSVAIARAGRPVYVEAFGLADRQTGEALTTAHRFRIASVTKPITSVAIFTLIEQDRLRLTDRIFGPNAVLGTDYGAPPYGPYIERITVEHLLTHTGGGWSNDARDPMLHNPVLDHARLIAWTLQSMPLANPPGTAYAYSNFGFCLLGRVIEKVTGQSYETFARDVVLRRCGISDMEIAGNTVADRRPGEVRYEGAHDDGDPYGMNVARMDSHGGWIATPTDLVRFAKHVDGFSTTPNILRPETVAIMTTASSANSRYAKGWMVNVHDNWWHGGSLPGTTTIMVRTHGGFCWAAFANTRRPGAGMGGDLDHLIWKMAAQVSGWNP